MPHFSRLHSQPSRPSSNNIHLNGLLNRRIFYPSPYKYFCGFRNVEYLYQNYVTSSNFITYPTYGRYEYEHVVKIQTRNQAFDADRQGNVDRLFTVPWNQKRLNTYYGYSSIIVCISIKNLLGSPRCIRI